MTRICLISDTHNKHNELNPNDLESDILIHAGDMTSMGSLQEMQVVNDWFGALNMPDIVNVSGNHDFYSKHHGKERTKKLFTNSHYLENDLIELNGLKIYGSPYSVNFGMWAFMKSEKELDDEWAKIPENIDILITHTPMHGVLDWVENKGSVGSVTLMHHVLNRIRPKLLVCGHLHLMGCQMTEVEGIKVVNAAMCDESYNINRTPIIVEL